jgi:subtilisin family serine protease
MDAIDLRGAWELSRGEGVTVVVLDLAVAEHPDLDGKLDARLDGVGVRPTRDPALTDHGTAMASIVGAEPDNATGTAGVGLDVRLVSIDMGQRYAGFTALGPERRWDRRHLVPLFRQAAAVPGVRIVSFSSHVNPSAAFERQIERMVDAGIVVVAGAGNEDDLGVTSPRYPAAYDGVIGAGAVLVAGDGTVGVWTRSNVGDHVDVYAPANVPALRSTGEIDIAGGTSSATAVTSGVIALLLARRPDLSPADVERLLVRTATPLPPLAIALDGGGAEVTEVVAIPGAPRVLLLDAGALLRAAVGHG